MTGLEYEHQVAKYLSHHGYTGVQVTKGSGDFGVDVIAHKNGVDRTSIILIQSLTH